MEQKNSKSCMDIGEDYDQVAGGAEDMEVAANNFMRKNERQERDSIENFFRKKHEEADEKFTTWLMTAPLEEFDECRKAWLHYYGLGSRKRTRMPRFGC